MTLAKVKNDLGLEFSDLGQTQKDWSVFSMRSLYLKLQNHDR